MILDRGKGFDSVKIRDFSRNRCHGEITPMRTHPVDRVGVGPAEAFGEAGSIEGRPPRPASARAARLEVDRHGIIDHATAPLEAMPVRTELYLQVTITRPQQKELEDFEFPQPVQASRSVARGGVIVVGGVDPDFYRFAENQFDLCFFPREEWFSVPCPGDLEAMARHVYTPRHEHTQSV
jgi:hypothetical protein